MPVRNLPNTAKVWEAVQGDVRHGPAGLGKCRRKKSRYGKFTVARIPYCRLKALLPKSFTSSCITRMLSDCAALSRLDLYVSAIYAVCFSEIRSCKIAALSARAEIKSQNCLGIV